MVVVGLEERHRARGEIAGGAQRERAQVAVRHVRADGVEIRDLGKQLAQRRVVEQRFRRADHAAREQRTHPAGAGLEHGAGVGAEHLGHVEIGPDVLDFAHRLMPARDVAGQDAGRNGAGRGAHDDGERPVGAGMDLGERLEHAHLVGGARAAARQDQTRASHTVAAARYPPPPRPIHFHGEHHARTSKDFGHRPDRGDCKCMRTDSRRVTRGRTAAPALKLQDQAGKWHTLNQYKGKWVVLYFYPKDFTGGCTTQACELRDNIFAFRKADAVILGVSVDDVASHKKFAKEHSLPFDILADPNKEVSKKYGVLTTYGTCRTRQPPDIPDRPGRQDRQALGEGGSEGPLGHGARRDQGAFPAKDGRQEFLSSRRSASGVELINAARVSRYLRRQGCLGESASATSVSRIAGLTACAECSPAARPPL